MTRARHAATRSPAPPIVEDAARLGLVFEAGRGKLRLERPVVLASPAATRPVVLRSLDLDIGPVRFPLDVSGGATRFRTRRMGLVGAAIGLPLPALEALVSRRLRWLGRAADARVRLASEDAERGVSLVVTIVAREARSSPLVFQLELIADGLDLIALVHGARAAADGPRSPTAHALGTLSALGASWDGAAMRFARPHARVLAEVLVARGHRLPDVSDVRMTTPRIVEDDVIEIGWSREVGADGVPVHQGRLLDVHRRLGACDGALVRDERADARAALSVALASVPRAPQLLLRLAELDADQAGLEPSVRSALAELDGDARSNAVVAALQLRLALRLGELEEAAGWAELLATDTSAPELGAAALASAGDALLATRPELGAALLWRASALRRTDVRLHARLLEVAGRAGLDLATIEELGARWLGAADDADARAEAALATARAALSIDALPEARAWFERVLRYQPRSRGALVGLGRVLVALRDAARALRVLGRAIELADEASDRALASEAFRLLAELHTTLGDESAALDAATAAAERLPHDPTAWSRVAELRDATGDPHGAAVAAGRSFDELRRARASLPGGARDAIAPAAGGESRSTKALDVFARPDAEADVSDDVAVRAADDPSARPAHRGATRRIDPYRPTAAEPRPSDGLPHPPSFPPADAVVAAPSDGPQHSPSVPADGVVAPSEVGPGSDSLHVIRRRLDRGDSNVEASSLGTVVDRAIADPATVLSLEALDDLAAVAGIAGRRDAARVAAVLAQLLATGHAPPMGDPMPVHGTRRQALVRELSGGSPTTLAIERAAHQLATRCLPPRDWVREAARDHALVHLARDMAANVGVRPRRLLLGPGHAVRSVWLPDGVALVVGRALPDHPKRLSFLLAAELIALEHGAVSVPLDALVDVLGAASTERAVRAEIVEAAHADLRDACRFVALLVTRDPSSAVAALCAVDGNDPSRLLDASARERALARSSDAQRLASWALRGELLTR